MQRNNKKISRNQPCSCGSGKKYKKCCLIKKASLPTAKEFKIPREAIKEIQKQIAKQKALENVGIYINYVKPEKYTNPKTKKEHKAWALGSTLFHTRDPNETFHQFIIDRLRQTLGKEWWERELELFSKRRHFVMKCFVNLSEWQRRDGVKREKITKEIWAAKPDGWTKSLLSLAFDICSLIHARHLPQQLLNRLKNQNEYQGARYEIAVAAIFARLGCDIDFLDENERLTIKHCEFIATHQKTGISVAVEVKSRHRSGVLHTLGIRKEEDLLKGDVQKLLNRALKQNPGDRPFLIFVDINSPITPSVKVEEKQWFQDIKKMIGSYNAPTPENPDPYNGIFFTNYSYHYQTEKEAEPGEYLSITSLHPKFSLPDSNFLIMLNRAVANYGNVPNLDLEYDNTKTNSNIVP
ncbi:YecA family protein [Patescibacteria group bacterium]